MAFHVGQKVVCVAPPTTAKDFYYENFPTLNQVYTIRELINGGRGVLLHEIVNPNRAGGEGAFWPRRFRPVVERKTDIAIFTALLNPINHKHLEGV